MVKILALLVGLMVSSAMANEVQYQLEGNTYQGYFVAQDQADKLVLLIHDWNGLTEYEQRRADMLAEAGYAVFAADLFGKGIRPTEDVDKRQHTGELYQDRQKMRRLVMAALDTAGELGANTRQVVIMGYCFGGAVALEMARAGSDFLGYVSFHGGLGTPEGQDYSQTQGEILVLHGTADPMISMQDFAALAEALEQHQVPNEMIAYGGADHAFTEFDDARYHPEADRRSWQRFLGFLEDRFASH
ncbi:dienelactone hydrolase [Methylophaga lonarensis MPL]|uniref:Dienelactone hydrolase n=1 Tax=Methylophaga lonarensis MPL TaxID=1286106 RepID=M7P409_9GAMM|nr:dienelactone hydrolase family protein [Methylophaga lonarensis]EMR14247.1 dienelactone hydrolase [Methylophaga lonarensis MPL]